VQGLGRGGAQEHDEDGLVGECSTAGQVNAAVATFRPAVVLLDVFLPDGSGLDVLGDVTEQHPELAVVVLTSSQDEEHLLAALRAGAVSYLPKTARADQVVAAVRAAARGESVLEPRLARPPGPRPARP
jgi:two-component system, NarL family, response regulator LiaR